MEPKIAQKAPYVVELEAEKDYHWCACGQSKNQPFCDGSHRDTEFNPMAFKAEASGPKHLCGCKHSGNKPFCDGSHLNL